MQIISIPVNLDAITPEWLTGALQESKYLPPGIAVTDVVRSDAGSAQSHVGQLTRLALTYSEADPRLHPTMIAKMHASEPYLRSFARFLYANETRFYQELSGRVSIAIPECYLALVNDDGSESLLLIEDLASRAEPGDSLNECTRQQAVAAIKQLGQFHAGWWNSPELDTIPWLRVRSARADSDSWRMFMSAVEAFSSRLGELASRNIDEFARRLLANQPVIESLYTRSPQSLLHGDYRLANLAFGTPESDSQVYAFDWQTIARGPALIDVAWFMVSSLTPAQRSAWGDSLLDVYHSSLQSARRQSRTRAQLSDDLRVAMLGAFMFGFIALANVRNDPGAHLGTFVAVQKRIDAAITDFNLYSLLSE